MADRRRRDGWGEEKIIALMKLTQGPGEFVPTPVTANIVSSASGLPESFQQQRRQFEISALRPYRADLAKSRRHLAEIHSKIAARQRGASIFRTIVTN